MQKLFITIFILMFSVLCFGQNDNKNEIEFSICQPSMTEAGRQSSFHFNYIYRISTDSDGKIKDVREIGDFKKFRGLMDDKNVVPCIKQWKLKPSERYIVYISIGTTSAENSFKITNKTTEIKFIL